MRLFHSFLFIAATLCLSVEAVSKKDVKFLLHTAINPHEPVAIFSAADLSALKLVEDFDNTLPVKITIHGWKGGVDDIVNYDLVAAYLNRELANVFVVDWSIPADSLYVISRSNVDEVGEIVADLIIYLIKEMGVKKENFELAGHSLGAHVAGFAGKSFKKRGYGLLPFIAGLDPAGPLFYKSIPSGRLDKGDAEYVQILHTDNTLGMTSTIGHADYFPNGGDSQPGCGFDFGGGCAHNRAPAYYAESIANDQSFQSFKAKSYSEFKKGKYDPADYSWFGGLTKNLKAAGEYYLNTNDIPYYSKAFKP